MSSKCGIKPHFLLVVIPYFGKLEKMNTTEITALIVALTTGIGSLIGGIVLWRKSRPETRKIQAESNKIMAEESKERTEGFKTEVEVIRETYSKMLGDQIKGVVEPMEHRIDRLRDQVKELQKEIDDLKRYRSLFDISILYIRSLCHWFETLNISKGEKPPLPPELRSYFSNKGEL